MSNTPHIKRFEERRLFLERRGTDGGHEAAREMLDDLAAQIERLGSNPVLEARLLSIEGRIKRLEETLLGYDHEASSIKD